jgi:hypothetical protein
MNSEYKIYNINKIENLLIKNWTDYIEVRKLIELLTENAKNQYVNPKINSIKVSNCSLTARSFSLWIDYNIITYNSNVNVTSEIFLMPDETIVLNKTI